MGSLSFQSYVLKCILGAEIFYVVCRIYPYFLNGEAKALHDTLWQIAIPGFLAGSLAGLVWGFIYIAIIAAIFGAYMAWMHNSSIKS